MLSAKTTQAMRPQAARAAVRAVSVRPARFVMARVAQVEEKAAAEPVAAKEEDVPDVQPSTKEVENLLSVLVNQTTIAELHLQVGSFELKVKRSTGAPATFAMPAPVAAAPSSTVVIAKPGEIKPAETIRTLEESVDESLVYVTSPKVGIFRRGKYAGGKRIGKGNACDKGTQVKKGQVLGYVEQLGTFVAVEAPQAGEVTSFLIEDGGAIEYKQQVVELAPFFGGHIIGDSKYA